MLETSLIPLYLYWGPLHSELLLNHLPAEALQSARLEDLLLQLALMGSERMYQLHPALLSTMNLAVQAA